MEDAGRMQVSLMPTLHQQHMLLLSCSIDLQLTQYSSTHSPGDSLSFLFLWYMNLAFFVAQEMASAETGVLYSGLLPTLKFLSKCVSNEPLPLTSWTNYLTTVLLFSAGHQCCDAPHQMACSCYTTVHTEASAACACQQHSACRNQEGLPGIWSCGQSNADAKFDMSKECSGN